MESFKPTPVARTLAFFVATGGALLTHSAVALFILLAVCVAVLAIQGNFFFFSRLALRFWLPLALGLCILWGFIVRGSPFAPRSAGVAVGLAYAGIIALRLLTLVALFQAAILSLRGLSLANVLTRLRLRPYAVASLVSIFNLWPTFAREANHVVTARCARGLMPNRRLWTRVKQFPWALRTLFIGSLSTSFDRAERWEAEGLPQRLVDLAIHTRRDDSLAASVGWSSGAVAWFILALWARF
jgi:hypothetical protein